MSETTTPKAPRKKTTTVKKDSDKKVVVKKSKTITVTLPKKLEIAFNAKVDSGYKTKSEVLRGLIEEWVSK